MDVAFEDEDFVDVDFEDEDVTNDPWEIQKCQGFIVSFGKIKFPCPTGINVNMMPYIIGNHGTIPDDLHPYREIIELCEGSSSNPPTGRSGDRGLQPLEVPQARGGAGDHKPRCLGEGH